MFDLCAAPEIYSWGGLENRAYESTGLGNNLENKMLTVSELSKAAKVTPDAIRHYVRIGLLTPSRNPDNGYKQFSDDDINKAKFIRRAKGLGFTLRDIQNIFDHSNEGRSPCPEVRDMIRQRINDNKSKLAELNALQQRMDDALEQWESMPDGEHDGEAICHLIESVV